MTSSAAIPSFPFDLTEGTPFPVIKVDQNQFVAVMRAGNLFGLVPDPERAEMPVYTAGDPHMQEYAAMRRETQRAYEGAKKKNSVKFAGYIQSGLRNERHFVLPAITVYSPKKITVNEIGHGFAFAMIPMDGIYVCIDGETQRKALQIAAAQNLPIKVVFHHDRPTEWARQAFHDLNVLEVKPNSAVSVSMDTQDIATNLTRQVAKESDVVRGRLHLTRRSLRRSDSEVLTISALRTGIVTTLLGGEGLQKGARPIGELEAVGGVEPDLEAVTDAVTESWVETLEILADELEPSRRPESVVSAPVVLAGIGMVLHRTIPRPPRSTTGSLELEEVLNLLRGINWSRSAGWDGICGKWVSTDGVPLLDGLVSRLSIGSPKELGHAVADAILHPESDRGKRIRSQS